VSRIADLEGSLVAITVAGRRRACSSVNFSWHALERVSLRALGVFGNRALVGAVALTVALQALLVLLPVFRDVLGLQPLTAGHWLMVTAVALAYLGLIERGKTVVRVSR
jgi:hypothetical protein